MNGENKSVTSRIYVANFDYGVDHLSFLVRASRTKIPPHLMAILTA